MPININSYFYDKLYKSKKKKKIFYLLLLTLWIRKLYGYKKGYLFRDKEALLLFNIIYIIIYAVF